MGIITWFRRRFKKKLEPSEDERAAVNRLKEWLRGPLPDDLRREIEQAILGHCKKYGLPRPFLGDPYR